jgi:protein involved in polysaccharide export with SLBB domain
MTRSNASRAPLGILLAVLATACEAGPGTTDFDPGVRQDPRPAWVDHLDEKVGDVPAEVQAEGARLSTPTAWPPGAAGISRGSPRDLTAPWTPGAAVAADRDGGAAEAGFEIPGAAAPGAAPPGAAGVFAGGTATDEVGGVTVHVHTVEPPDAGDPAPEPASTLERLYGGEAAAAPAAALEQFGYVYFAREIDAGAVGFVMPDYVVLPGDELRVVITGTLKDEVRRTVEPDGTIIVPEAGAVTVGGRSLSEIADLVQREIEARANRHGFFVDVSMAQARGFRVHVVGEVRRPGLVEVPGRATVLTALAAAGGPRKTGSLRRVEVRRGGVSVATIDMYRFLLTGDTAGLDTLRTEDVIVVPPVGPTVAVSGSVQRPGIYELTGATTVADALRLAGGLTPFTFTPNAQIERTVAGRGRERAEVALDEAGLQTTMGDGEHLQVGTVDGERQTSVRVEGEVVRPGAYPFRDGMTVADLLRLADGLTVDAYLPQAMLSRQVGEVGTVAIVPQRESLGTTRRVLVIDLAAALGGDPAADVELRPLDLLQIRSRRAATTTPTVEIIGAVRQPGSYELTAGLTVSQLVAIAGNVLPEVYYDEAELLRRAYEPEQRALTVQRYRFDLGEALREGGEHDPVLANQDQLVIRSLQASQVRVRVRGRVRFPGEYVFPKGARITDLVAAAGGVLEDGDLRATVFQRESVRELQASRFERLRDSTLRAFERSFEEMVASGFPNESLASRISLDQTRASLERMGEHQGDGRVVIPFLRPDFPRSAHDLTLEEGDVLTIPARQETVAVVGYVFNPGAFVAEPGVTVADLIARSGGLQEDGDDERLYVIRADGTVQGFAQRHYRLSQRTELLAGDVVLVPRRPLSRTFGNQLSDVLFATRRFAEIALMLSNIDDLEQLQFTSLLQEPRLDSNIDALQRGLIQSSINSPR